MKDKINLNTYSNLKAVHDTEDDGITHINISAYGTTSIGKKLAPGYPANFTTIFGKVGTIRSLMDFIVTPGYPTNILSKSKLTMKDIKKIPNNKISVPNYWAIMVYVMAERIMTDKELLKELKELDSDITFTSYNVKTTMLFGKVTKVLLPNIKMKKYIAVIMLLKELIDSDNFNEEEIEKLANKVKEKPELDIFENTAVAVLTEA